MTPLNAKRELSVAVTQNNKEYLGKILDMCEKNKEDLIFPTDPQEMIATACAFASNMARRKKLTEEMATEILRRSSELLDIQIFLHLINIGADPIRQFDIIPYALRSAIIDGNDDPAAAKEILFLTPLEFERLLIFITTAGNGVATNLKEMIVLYMNDNKFLEQELLFAYLSLTHQMSTKKQREAAFVEEVAAAMEEDEDSWDDTAGWNIPRK